MKLKEIIEKIADYRVYDTPDDIADILKIFLDIIKKELESNKKIVIENFGTFKMKKYKPRKHFIKGKIIQIPSRRRIKFTMSRKYKIELDKKDRRQK